MLKSLRTYRLLRALLATTLLLSISLPLVRYACGMSGTSLVVTPSTPDPDCAKANRAGTDAEQPCHTDAVSAALCPHADLCSSMTDCLAQEAAVDETACCAQETLELEDVFTLDSKRAESYLIVPLSAILAKAVVEAQLSPPLFSQPSSEQTPRTQIPLRVLFSSFVI